MDNLNQDTCSNNYNDEPVFYCKSCLSLRIKTVMVESNLDYCDECGSTAIEKTSIDEWRHLYKERYGIDYLDKKIK